MKGKSKRSSIKTLSLAEVEHVAHSLAQRLMEWDEPIPPFDTRFPTRLESCLKTPFQKFGGKSLYPRLEGKAAILFYLMIKNHPFQNGNKRVAVMTLLYFLAQNKRWFKVSNEQLYIFANGIAKGDPKNKDLVLKNTISFLRKYVVERDFELS